MCVETSLQYSPSVCPLIIEAQCKWQKSSLFLWKLTTFPRRTTYDTDRIPILTVFPGNSSLSSPVSTVKIERWWRRKKQFGRSERVTFWIYSYCFFLAFPLTDTFSLLSLHFLLLNCISVWIITWNYRVLQCRSWRRSPESSRTEDEGKYFTIVKNSRRNIIIIALVFLPFELSTFARGRGEWKSH